MNVGLYKVIFACTFGKRSSHMFLAAVFRIALLYGAALALGWILAWNITGFYVENGFSVPIMFACIFGLHTVVVLCLCASSGILRPGRHDVTNRLFLSLPLSPPTIWRAIVLPGFTLSGIAACFVGPVLFSILARTQVWPIASVVVLFATTLSAIGYLYGIPRRVGLKAMCLVPLVLGAEYYSITNLTGTGLERAAAYSFLLVVLIGGWILLVLSKDRLPYEASVAHQELQTYFRLLPTPLWFFKKAARSPVMQSGSIATFMMSSTFVIACFYLGAHSISLYAIVASLLGAALVSDTRSLSRGKHPPEIIGLKASFRFVTTQLATVSIITLLLLSPLLFGGIYHLMQTPTSIISGVTQLFVPLIVGLAAGFSSSTFVAPGPKDISAQSGATLLAISLLALPQLPLLSSMDDGVLQLMQLGFAAVLFVLAYIAEYIRNPFLWRKNHGPIV